jgi:hypothetical protein
LLNSSRVDIYLKNNVSRNVKTSSSEKVPTALTPGQELLYLIVRLELVSGACIFDLISAACLVERLPFQEFMKHSLLTRLSVLLDALRGGLGALPCCSIPKLSRTGRIRALERRVMLSVSGVASWKVGRSAFSNDVMRTAVCRCWLRSVVDVGGHTWCWVVRCRSWAHLGF